MVCDKFANECSDGIVRKGNIGSGQGKDNRGECVDGIDFLIFVLEYDGLHSGQFAKLLVLLDPEPPEGSDAALQVLGGVAADCRHPRALAQVH